MGGVYLVEGTDGTDSTADVEGGGRTLLVTARHVLFPSNGGPDVGYTYQE